MPASSVLILTPAWSFRKRPGALAKGGQTLAETDCDAPWVLFKAPPGRYTATATLIGGSGQSNSASFSIGSAGQKEVNILFKAPSAPPATQ